MFTILYNTLLESSPYVVLGFLIAGIMRYWVPPSVLRHQLGGQSPGALFKSVGIGCVLPLCSCGTIPLGIGLFRSGASVGNMLAFMTSTPILSPVLVALSLKLLGVKLTLTLLVASIAGALIMGGIGNRLFQGVRNERSGRSPERTYTPEKSTGTNGSGTGKSGNRGRAVSTLRWSFFELGADVSVDIAIGLGIASLLMAVLPLEWISRWLGQQDLLTLVYVVLMGIPVYACSIPSIAVVQGLLLLGATPGAAIAYMIAGPATNLGELNAIRRSMGGRPAAYYAGILVLMALLAGTVTDRFIFPDYQYHAFRIQGELVVRQCCVPMIFGEGVDTTLFTRAIPAWFYPFGILLGIIMAFGVYKKLRGFLINPCSTCTWKSYGMDGYCGSKCHVRRKYEFFRSVLRRIPASPG